MGHRRVGPMIVACCLGSSALAAQTWGPASLGLQGGFSYIKYDGTRYFDSELNLPGLTYGPSLPLPRAVFVTVPLSSRLALEPSVSVGVSSSNLVWSNTLLLGVRGDYLITRSLYAAAGIAAGRGASGTSSGATSRYTFGVQGAIGARLRLAGPLVGRAEAVAQLWAKNAPYPAQNIYSLMVGVSAPVTTRRSVTAPDDRALPHRPWELSLGISSSFVDQHYQSFPTDIISFSFPGHGTESNGVSPPVLFATIPLKGRLALEPGLEVHRSHDNNFTYGALVLSARLNYALGRGWYAGPGLEFVTRKASDTPYVGFAGVSAQGGYQFHLTGAWGGRVEVSHTIMARQGVWHEPPLTVTAITIGATVAMR